MDIGCVQQLIVERKIAFLSKTVWSSWTTNDKIMIRTDIRLNYGSLLILQSVVTIKENMMHRALGKQYYAAAFISCMHTRAVKQVDYNRFNICFMIIIGKPHFETSLS